MEHGPDAIRSMESNGLTWTIDPNAPEADLIQPDKIIFVTGRVVGRVLAVDRTGNNLRVTLGPVAITDVIKEANISSDQPLDLNARQHLFPQAVTSAINFILRKLNVRTIEGSDGTDHTESLISEKDAFPAGCADK